MPLWASLTPIAAAVLLIANGDGDTTFVALSLQ